LSNRLNIHTTTLICSYVILVLCYDQDWQKSTFSDKVSDKNGLKKNPVDLFY